MSPLGRAVVVLLKSVNLGPTTTVHMAPLRQELNRLGCADVESYRASGNLLLTTTHTPAALLELVASATESTAGRRVLAVTIERAALVEMLASEALDPRELDPSRFLLTVLSEVPDPALVGEHPLEELCGTAAVQHGRVVAQRCPDGIAKAPNVVAFVERHWGVLATARNLATLEALAERLERRGP